MRKIEAPFLILHALKIKVYAYFNNHVLSFPYPFL